MGMDQTRFAASKMVKAAENNKTVIGIFEVNLSDWIGQFADYTEITARGTVHVGTSVKGSKYAMWRIELVHSDKIPA